MIEGIYWIIERSEERVVIKLAEKNHPLFSAHFPGNPILPGFVQIEIVADIVGESIVGIHYSKFISHLFPNDILVCEIRKEGTVTRAKILKDSKKVSEIAYESQ